MTEEWKQFLLDELNEMDNQEAGFRKRRLQIIEERAKPTPSTDFDKLRSEVEEMAVTTKNNTTRRKQIYQDLGMLPPPRETE